MEGGTRRHRRCVRLRLFFSVLFMLYSYGGCHSMASRPKDDGTSQAVAARAHGCAPPAVPSRALSLRRSTSRNVANAPRVSCAARSAKVLNRAAISAHGLPPVRSAAAPLYRAVVAVPELRSRMHSLLLLFEGWVGGGGMGGWRHLHLQLVADVIPGVEELVAPAERRHERAAGAHELLLHLQQGFRLFLQHLPSSAGQGLG